MLIKACCLLLLSFMFSSFFEIESKGKHNSYVYQVYRLKEPINIDGIWNKPQWHNIKAVDIENYMGDMPKFRPSTQAKLMYNDENLYLIFRVHDRYVRCVTKNYNGPVFEDACVEFFFSPDIKFPNEYFDLEINCGGIPLFCYAPITKMFTVEDIKKIEIAHSLPQKVDPEISGPITWTIECKIPLIILEKYSNIIHPNAGVSWKANFFKTASKGSNPHYLTWAVVKSDKPNFHLPQFFGTLEFK